MTFVEWLGVLCLAVIIWVATLIWVSTAAHVIRRVWKDQDENR
jgi:hypothetical protein